MSAEEVRRALIEQKGYSDSILPSLQTIAARMRALGYRPRRSIRYLRRRRLRTIKFGMLQKYKLDQTTIFCSNLSTHHLKNICYILNHSDTTTPSLHRPKYRHETNLYR